MTCETRALALPGGPSGARGPRRRRVVRGQRRSGVPAGPVPRLEVADPAGVTLLKWAGARTRLFFPEACGSTDATFVTAAGAEPGGNSRVPALGARVRGGEIPGGAAAARQAGGPGREEAGSPAGENRRGAAETVLGRPDADGRSGNLVQILLKITFEKWGEFKLSTAGGFGAGRPAGEGVLVGRRGSTQRSRGGPGGVRRVGVPVTRNAHRDPDWKEGNGECQESMTLAGAEVRYRSVADPLN
jgi:hypothetical protein